MKNLLSLSTLLLALLLSACSNDDFSGRYTDADGQTSYTFLPEGQVHVTTAEREINASYAYDASDKTMTLSGEGLDAVKFTLNNHGELIGHTTALSRAADEALLIDSTWIGDEGQYTFALTFSQTDKGLNAFSELVSYYDDEMEYVYQTDDSITRFQGNLMMLDMTKYTVSEVTDNSMKLSIGGKSMVIHKHPKGTPIEFREGYTNVDNDE